MYMTWKKEKLGKWQQPLICRSVNTPPTIGYSCCILNGSTNTTAAEQQNTKQTPIYNSKAHQPQPDDDDSVCIHVSCKVWELYIFSHRSVSVNNTTTLTLCAKSSANKLLFLCLALVSQPHPMVQPTKVFGFGQHDEPSQWQIWKRQVTGIRNAFLLKPVRSSDGPPLTNGRLASSLF